MPYKDKEKQKEYEKEWIRNHPSYQKIYWNKNKHRYRNRILTRLGTNQDEQILKFIKNKREGKSTAKYKALPARVFKHNNQAQQSYPEYVRGQEDKFNNNYDGEVKGFKWIEGVGYVTEDPDAFFD